MNNSIGFYQWPRFDWILVNDSSISLTSAALYAVTGKLNKMGAILVTALKNESRFGEQDFCRRVGRFGFLNGGL